MRHCQSCGAECHDDTNYCYNCGNKLTEPELRRENRKRRCKEEVTAPRSETREETPIGNQPAISPTLPQAAGDKDNDGTPSRREATATLIFGILACAYPTSVLFLCGVFGIVYGHLTLHRIRRRPQRYAGKGRAIWGLILSYLGVAIGVLLGLYIAKTRIELNEFLSDYSTEPSRIALPAAHEVEATGTVARGLYTNSYFGLSLDIPEGWMVLDDNMKNRIFKASLLDTSASPEQSATIDLVDEVGRPLLTVFKYEIALRPFRNPGFTLIAINVDSDPTVATSADLLAAVAEESRSTPEDTRITRPGFVTQLGGIEFRAIEAEQDAYGSKATTVVYTAIVRGYGLMLSTWWYDAGEKREIHEVLQTVSFRGAFSATQPRGVR